MMHSVEQIVSQRLTEVFSPTFLEVRNESEQHIGHAGALGGAQHLFIRIVSAQFSSINAVQRHRLIYNTMLDLMPDQIHAVRIDARVV
ncbi:MAG: bolA [Burkholderiaceae bacterium]|nr:bolA [Burkholderiaceae bacterium]